MLRVWPDAPRSAVQAVCQRPENPSLPSVQMAFAIWSVMLSPHRHMSNPERGGPRPRLSLRRPVRFEVNSGDCRAGMEAEAAQRPNMSAVRLQV